MINVVKREKITILFIIVIGIIVFMPIMINSNNFLIINNDTANHLKVFEAMKNGNASTSYLGQKITGYTLVWVEDVTGIDLKTLFMIFNFMSLFIAGIVIMILVRLITENKLVSMLATAIIIFGVSATIHLFKSGTIFNLNEYLILLPVELILVYLWTKKWNHWYLIPIGLAGTLLFFYHPSFGIGIRYITEQTTQIANSYYNESAINMIESTTTFFGIANFIALLFCLYTYFKNNWTKKINSKVIIVSLLTTASIAMYVAAAFGVTPYPSRLAINASLLMGIALCIWIGLTFNDSNKITKVSVISLIAIGVLPNLIQWFNWKSLYNSERGVF